MRLACGCRAGGRGDSALRLTLVGLAAVLGAMAPAAPAKVPPLRDPVFLNIGFVCQWQQRCIDRQQKAMRRSIAYVKRHDPPDWKVQVCNRNAGRNGTRVDWVGYENCITNPQSRPLRRGK